ncbi:MAG: hypothetical protein DRJ40_08790 [Thermoprotei archaeon]|nr:MAG: hypothetical protein DRJ40_08790 [Thermoprotei archaeon]
MSYIERVQSKEDSRKRYLMELIDGESVMGAAIIDSSGVPILWHLPPSLTAKSISAVMAMIEYLMKVKQTTTDLLGQHLYTVVRFQRFKVAYFDLEGKGWLIIFVNPIWHVELLLPKVRKVLHQLTKLL